VTRPAGSSRLLRAMNETAVLAHLFDRGPLTRGELRELTGLSKPTASEVLRRLEDAGLALVVGHASGGPGPNAAIYATNPGLGFAVALSIRDVGPSRQPSLTATIADLAGVTRATTQAEISFDSVDPVDAVADAVTELCGKARIPRKRLLQVQLAVPGSPDPRADRIRYVDVPGLDRPGLLGQFRSRLRTEVEVDNDVNLAAMAERAHGVAAGVDGFAVLWLGAEGAGFAIDQGGTLLRGANGCAGEIGYMPVPGASDFQDLVGGAAVLDLGRRHAIPGETPQDLVAAAAHGEPDRRRSGQFLRTYAERIALALATVVTLIDPPLIVLGGEVGKAGGERLRDSVVDALQKRSPLDTETRIEVTAVDGDPVLLGAQQSGLAAMRERLLAGLTTAQQTDAG
jgi:predicted NBD/HSP70 family sugar kinase